MNDTPTTPAALFDQLHEWFGIGEYDEMVTDKPWHRARMVEIGKLKRLLKSRRASLAEVYVAACYARRLGKPVHATWQVFSLIPEAMRDRFRMASEAKRAEAWGDLADAINHALNVGETEWAERMLRAEDPAKVLAEWRSSR